MSTQPNAILLLCLKPNDLARKTLRAILAEKGNEADSEDARVKIGAEKHSIMVMENGYDEGFQITADEGDIIVFSYVTYGFGERIAWDNLVEKKAAFEAWAKGICERHKCSYSIFVTANYW